MRRASKLSLGAALVASLALSACEVISGLNALHVVGDCVGSGCDGGAADGAHGDVLDGSGESDGQGTLDGAGGDSGSDGGQTSPSATALRPLAPQSTSVVTTLTPYFTWIVNEGVVPDSTVVEICSDHGCSASMRTVTPTTPTDTMVKPMAPLGLGPVFWRLRWSIGGVQYTSAVWQFWAQNAMPGGTTYAVWGSVLDVNADGYTDTIVGAPAGGADAGSSATGSAFLYMGSPAGPVQISATISPPNPAKDDGSFGASVASVDANGDGFADIAIGSPNENRVYYYYGGPGGVSAAPSKFVEYAMGGRAGTAISPGGDVNGDGYGDVIVGAALAGTGGQAVVFLGDPDQPKIGPTAIGTTGTGFGQSVAGACDFNRDGKSDFVVGAPIDPSGGKGNGSVNVFYGAGDGTLRGPTILYGDIVTTVNLGSSVACAGDIDGDGFSDVAAGDPGGGPGSKGEVLTFRGGPFNVTALGMGGAVLLPPNADAVKGFGKSINGVGDLSADGFDELAVGAPGIGSGTVYVVLGTTFENFGASTVKTLSPDGTGAGMGSAIAGPGDYQGDGLFDVRTSYPQGNAGLGVLLLFDGLAKPNYISTTLRAVPGRGGVLFGTSIQ